MERTIDAPLAPTRPHVRASAYLLLTTRVLVCAPALCVGHPMEQPTENQKRGEKGIATKKGIFSRRSGVLLNTQEGCVHTTNIATAPPTKGRRGDDPGCLWRSCRREDVNVCGQSAGSGSTGRGGNCCAADSRAPTLGRGPHVHITRRRVEQKGSRAEQISPSKRQTKADSRQDRAASEPDRNRTLM